jgi:hypothetical protein
MPLDDSRNGADAADLAAKIANQTPTPGGKRRSAASEGFAPAS